MPLAISLSFVWGAISIIWLLILYYTNRSLKEDILRFKFHHQRVIGLYVLLDRQNRTLIEQNKKFKAAVEDTIFYPKGLSLEEVAHWYSAREIDPLISNRDTSTDSIRDFLKQERDAKKYIASFRSDIRSGTKK